VHSEIRQWVSYVSMLLPEYFSNTDVLDVGALDVNGTNKDFFGACRYTGLDIGPGPNVDVVSVCHEYEKPDASYDVVISTDSLEHDMFYDKSLKKMYSLLRPNGLLIFTCASDGRGEHGTLNENSAASPYTITHPEWQNYYKNLNIEDIQRSLNLDELFIRHEHSMIVGSLIPWGKDFRFWGIKK
jgi:SAM-dependent methyltransferase